MSEQVDPVQLPAVGAFAIVAGHEYAATRTIGEAVTNLYMDREDWAVFRSPAEVSRSAPDARLLYVVVSDGAVDRYFVRRLRATWYGEDVDVEPVDTATARILYDRDPGLAKMMGMKGDQYSGFTAEVPYSELSDVRVIERDFPVHRTWLEG